MTNRLKTLILSIVCAVVVVAIGLTIFFLVGITAKLKTPENLEIVDNLPNGEIILQTDEIENAQKYVFLIRNGDERINLVSEENYISASSYFQESGLYKVSCRAVGKTSYSISDYCTSVEYIVRKNLATPNITLENDNQRLIFSTVEGATSYELIYGIDDNGEISKLTESRYFGGEAGKRYFDLSVLKKGVYSLRLIAKGGEYEQSAFTEPVLFTKYDKLEKPSNIVYNSNEKILSFNSDWYSFKLTIYYNETQNARVIQIEDKTSTHNINLSEYLDGDVSKIEIVALGKDDEFTISSEVGVWQSV